MTLYLLSVFKGTWHLIFEDKISANNELLFYLTIFLILPLNDKISSYHTKNYH